MGVQRESSWVHISAVKSAGWMVMERGDSLVEILAARMVVYLAEMLGTCWVAEKVKHLDGSTEMLMVEIQVGLLGLKSAEYLVAR